MAVSRSGFARVNEAELYYEVTGDGFPVVLIHGAWVDHRMWCDQVKALRDSYAVVRYDVRGHGRSSMPSIQYSHHEDLDGHLNHLKIGRADLVGLSMGGAIAVNAAIAYPERVRSLTIIPGSLPGYRWSDNTARLVAAIIDMAAAGNFLRANQMVLELVPTAAGIPSVRARLEEMFKDYSWVHVRTGNVALNRPLTPPAAERLAEITVATLIIQEKRISRIFRRSVHCSRRGSPGRGAL